MPDKLNVGHFLGFVPNDRALEEMHNVVKKMKAIKSRNIKFFLAADLMRFTQECPDASELKAKVVHVWVPKQQAE